MYIWASRNGSKGLKRLETSSLSAGEGRETDRQTDKL